MYSIVFLEGGEEKRNRVMTYLAERLIKEGRFTAGLTASTEKGLPSIQVKPVRLVKAKPYCGQHPDVCIVNPFLGPQKKPVNRYLEWDDWVKFHAFVNRVLNRFRTHANVWSEPPDVRGKFHIRKGLLARKRFDWTETTDRFGRRIQTWNTGDESQF